MKQPSTEAPDDTPDRTANNQRAALMALWSKPRETVAPAAPTLGLPAIRAIDDALVSLLPLGTTSVHATTRLPLPDMPVRVGFERNAMPVAVLMADAPLMAALVCHQCGTPIRKPSGRPGRFETGFLSGLAARLLPVLFGGSGDVTVAKVADADFPGNEGLAEGCADTQFIVTVPHKPAPVTGRLRIIAPTTSTAAATSPGTPSGPALRTTRVSARCHLPVRRMSLQQVAGLSEGSVLTLEPGQDAVLTINGRHFATGTYDGSAGKRSFRTHEHSRGDTP